MTFDMANRTNFVLFVSNPVCSMKYGTGKQICVLKLPWAKFIM
jgi:hypothetical protein